MISWKVMFFKYEKSKLKTFYVPTMFWRELLAPHSIGTHLIYKKEKCSNFPKRDLLSQLPGIDRTYDIDYTVLLKLLFTRT